jgi:hypothetical protein
MAGAGCRVPAILILESTSDGADDTSLRAHGWQMMPIDRHACPVLAARPDNPYVNAREFIEIELGGWPELPLPPCCALVAQIPTRGSTL